MSDDKRHFDPPSVRPDRAVLSTMSERSSAAAASLPLFQWQPPRRLILFPLTRRIGKVRHTARKLLTKHGDDAALYWKQVVTSNRKHLERIGLPDDEIDDQLREFFEAVQCELRRLTYSEQGTGGAA